MKKISLKCDVCRAIVWRNKGRINEVKKFNWKTYCSSACQGKVLSKKKRFYCTRKNCGNTFFRTSNRIRNNINVYCSRSCAAVVNNSQFPKRNAAISYCDFCSKKFKGHKIYCSLNCKNQSQIINKGELCNKISLFFKKYHRIPTKIEFEHYTTAQRKFGSWNRAIIAAGFKPNPQKFAQKHIAKDGHSCDSLAEKIIDDWLFEKEISHKRNHPYPCYPKPKLTCDFLIGMRYVEFFGLEGQHQRYTELVALKRKLAYKYNLHLIELKPQHLFPKNKLNIALSFLLNKKRAVV